MENGAFPHNDVRSFVIVFILVLMFSAAVVFLNVVYGHVPLLGSLPGDISIMMGSMPVRLPVSSCILVSAVLTGLAVLVSFLMRDPQ